MINTYKEPLIIIPINAEHCPGSVMFIIKGSFGSVLYTGDFRYTPLIIDDIKKNIQLPVDYLYYDDTYFIEKYIFPEKNEVAKKILLFIMNHSDSLILLSGYIIGKEELYIYLSQNLNVKIGVDKERYNLYEKLSINEYFTTDYSSTNIRIINRKNMKLDYIKKLNKIQPTIGLDISGLSETFSEYIIGFPYSLHSSYLEIKTFLKEIQYKKIDSINK